MTTKNNIPAGYKDSAVGIIPQEWKVKQLALLGKIFSGGTPSTDKEEYWGGNIMWCTPSDITSISSKYINNTKDRITAMGLKNSSAILLPINSIIVCTRATIGAAAITQVELSTNQGFKNIKPEKCNTEWLYYSMILNQPKLQRLGCGSTFLEVSKRDFERLKLAVPPLEEQRKIAEILGVWDEAIEKQIRLIEKLELRKRALMQRLLTGRTRLPGFTSPWQKVKLGEIGKTYNGITGKSKEDFEDGNAKFIPYINVFLNEKVNIDKLGVVSVDESEKQNKVQYGDIFFTVSSETPDEVGMASVLLEYIDDTYLNSFCFGYRLNDFETLNPIFASYILRGDRFRNYMMVLAQGSTRFNISKNEVMKLRIELPSLSEQKAIAEVLTMADNEIATHRKKLDTLRLQKRGLMQQLLTGKTRVKI